MEVGVTILTGIYYPTSFNLGSIITACLDNCWLDDNVPVSATESGAFKIANSWGYSFWGDNGFAWLPYSALVTTNSGLRIDYAYTCDVYPTEDNPINEPGISIVANIEHNHRSTLDYYVGHDTITDFVPDYMNKFETFSGNGNQNQMRGIFYPGPIDLAFNFSHFYADNIPHPFQKLFFKIDQDFSPEVGRLNSLTLIDKRWNEEFELSFPISDNDIINGDNLYHLDYYLLPHHGYYISIETELRSNMVSRFTTEVRNANLTLASNKEIHMYDGEIYINPYSAILLKDKSKIIAKRGFNKLKIDGALILNGQVEFIAENDALLQIDLNGQSFNLSGAILRV